MYVLCGDRKKRTHYVLRILTEYTSYYCHIFPLLIFCGKVLSKKLVCKKALQLLMITKINPYVETCESKLGL